MANFNTITVTPVASAGNTSPLTVTLTANSSITTLQYVQAIPKAGGVFLDDGSWMPSSAILRVTIS